MNILDGIQKDIKNILLNYVAVDSYTYTANENRANVYLNELFSEMPYFQEHPELYGVDPIIDDPYGRAVFWAMLKGKGDKTVVLVHHNDIVGIEDFKALKEKAFLPADLEKALRRKKSSLHPDAQADLDSKDFLFGRGVADMKGGGSIQIALLKRYSELKEFEGNVILIAVPDEENLSAGMRHAATILSNLKDEYNLDFRMMINSEPHQRYDNKTGVFSTGSIGKVLPYFYVRGFLSHVGKVFEGLNPLDIMTTIVQKTELNMNLSDVVENEVAPPPTWLYLRDGKTTYDVSMPISAMGCVSILTLGRELNEIMDELKTISEESFAEVIRESNEHWKRFSQITRRKHEKLPWKVKSSTYYELFEEAKHDSGEEFLNAFEEKREELINDVRKGEITIIQCNFNLVEFIFDFIHNESPRVVYGMVPPYYPAVANILIDGLDKDQSSLYEKLIKYVKSETGEKYVEEMFYTGISDLSYAAIPEGKEITELLEQTMPLYGEFYSIPFDAIEAITMPVINIGPWGKAFHKVTERVYKPDLYENTPKILHYAIGEMLKFSI